MEKLLTISEKHRQQGNEFFGKLKQEEHAVTVVRQGRFINALKCYNQALNTSMNNDERASAYKNLGVLSAYHIGNINKAAFDKKHLDYYLEQCITSYGHAYEFGRATKSQEWLSVLCRQINDFVDDSSTTSLTVPAEERLRILLVVARCFERTALKKLDSLAVVYYTLAQLTFRKAISRFKEEPQLIYDCLPYLDRAIYWARDPDAFLSNEVEELRHHIWLYQCMHESTNARRAGIRMLEAHLDNDKHLNMDIVWDIIDKFRQAILLAKEHDIEGEAYACHCTAIIYQNILNMAQLAYTYHLRCVTLAQTSLSRKLTSLDWYMLSSSFVQQHRAQKAREEEAIKETKRRKLYLELAADLKELDVKAKDSIHIFLQHIYTKHPPRKGNAKLGSVGSNELGKTVKKAITHYHPDAQSSYNDEKWTFLCSEITKILNVKYGLLDN